MEGEKLEYYGKYLEYSVMNMTRNEWNKTEKKIARNKYDGTNQRRKGEM